MRKSKLLAALLVCVVFIPAALAEDVKEKKEVKTDKDLIQGTWKVVKRVKNGKETPEKEVSGNPVYLKFAGDAATEMRGEKKEEGGFTLDSSAKPKRITMTGKTGDNAGKSFAGIYELSGDTLKIAYSIGEKSGQPPKEFTGGEGAGLLVLERQKKEAKSDKDLLQ